MDRWWRHCYGKCVKVPSSSNWNSILHTFISQSRTSNNSSVLNWFGWNPICALQLSLHIIDTSVTILKSNHFSSPPPPSATRSVFNPTRQIVWCKRHAISTRIFRNFHSMNFRFHAIVCRVLWQRMSLFPLFTRKLNSSHHVMLV